MLAVTQPTPSWSPSRHTTPTPTGTTRAGTSASSRQWQSASVPSFRQKAHSAGSSTSRNTRAPRSSLVYPRAEHLLLNCAVRQYPFCIIFGGARHESREQKI